MTLLWDKLVEDMLVISGNSLRIYATFIFIAAFFEYDKGRHAIKNIFYWVYVFLSSVFVLVWRNPAFNLISNLILMFLLTLFYKAKWRARIFVALLVLSVSILVESIIASIFQFHLSSYSLVITIFVSSLLLFSVAVGVRSHIHTREDHPTSLFHTFIISFISAITIFVVLVMTLPNLQKRHLWIGISMALLLLLNFLTIYLYDSMHDREKQIRDKELLKQQNNLYIKQYELIYQSQRHIRLLRHDMKGHILTIKTLLENKDPVEALKHVTDMYDFLLCDKNTVHSGNITVDSILNTKIQEASSDSIRMKTSVKIPAQLNIASFDLSAILINLLDNSIAAVKELENKEGASVSVSLELDRGVLYIQVWNPYNGNLIYENGTLKTTRHDAQNHGLGLESVYKAVEKYDGCITINQECQIFKVHVLLYNREPNSGG